MGQVESEMAGVHSSSSSSATPKSLESLLAEAAAFGNNKNESTDAVAERALQCPCIADLRNGPCGVQFLDAFLCFFKSTAEEKGSDCVHPFVAFQNCIKANPMVFSENMMEDGKEEVGGKRRLIPPIWARESKTRKSKL